MKKLLLFCSALATTALIASCNPNRPSSSLMNNNPQNTGGTVGQAQQQQPGTAASPGISGYDNNNQINNPDTGNNPNAANNPNNTGNSMSGNTGSNANTNTNTTSGNS